MHPLLGASDDRPALVDAVTDEVLSYRQLGIRVDRRSEDLQHLAGAVVFLGAGNDPGSVVDFLALFGVGATVVLVDPSLKGDTFAAWRTTYEPAAWLRVGETNIGASVRASSERPERVLLPTSGSTGSPKFVRLSATNIAVNAEQITEALAIGADGRAMAHLPLFYSFGLSVLSSHLHAGASVVLCPYSAMQPEFWRSMGEHDVTSLPGVPYSFEMFRRVGAFDMDLPRLCEITQAGGKLAAAQVLEIHNRMSPRGVRLWVMYGQTEATARISVLDPNDLPGAAGAVGRPVSGGTIELVNSGPTSDGEIVFQGPNVMLGYAESRRDLNGSDQLAGRLCTGDLGHVDPDGRLWITGRLKRIAKVFGTRVSLDDVEASLRSFGSLAAVDDAQGITVFLETDAEAPVKARDLERAVGLPARSIRLQTVGRLPVTPAGKIDYSVLRSWA